ncbi:hypothetical protein BDW22DRAFT_1359465 [Trametopsis cervina]|nr:hypothetical protein BDW22DRAFT_1359465 [Trametopsis cervina]
MHCISAESLDRHPHLTHSQCSPYKLSSTMDQFALVLPVDIGCDDISSLSLSSDAQASPDSGQVPTDQDRPAGFGTFCTIA